MSILFYNFAADNKKKGPIMSVTALQNVWEGLLAYNLSTANKRWLAERLWEQAESEESDALEPYTTEEINAMITESEADFASERFLSMEDARAHRRAHLAKLLEA